MQFVRYNFKVHVTRCKLQVAKVMNFVQIKITEDDITFNLQKLKNQKFIQLEMLEVLNMTWMNLDLAENDCQKYQQGNQMNKIFNLRTY